MTRLSKNNESNIYGNIKDENLLQLDTIAQCNQVITIQNEMITTLNSKSTSLKEELTQLQQQYDHLHKIYQDDIQLETTLSTQVQHHQNISNTNQYEVEIYQILKKMSGISIKEYNESEIVIELLLNNSEYFKSNPCIRLQIDNEINSSQLFNKIEFTANEQINVNDIVEHALAQQDLSFLVSEIYYRCRCITKQVPEQNAKFFFIKKEIIIIKKLLFIYLF